MKLLRILSIGILFVSILYGNGIPGESIAAIKAQLLRKEKIFQGRFPEYTQAGGWQFRDKVNWLTGFIGGEMWYLYDITADRELMDIALAQSDALLPYAGIDYTHDMGFIFLPTAVQAYHRTGEEKYRTAGILAADMLARRFNERGGFLRAWGKLGSDDRAGWMIIDTMMNLELLFWASEVTGNRDYYDIAYRHAITTMNESIRANGSSYHVIEFDPLTGKVENKRTHQGYSDESTWARGQAWGIYGFANAYRRTGDQRFLAVARKMADYMIQHLPEDFVPYWDLDLSGEDVLRDASAGAVAASGLFLLSEVEVGKVLSEKYAAWGEKITGSLLRNYLFTESKRPHEEGILLHTIYHYHNEWGVDESFPAGDYFFVEAVWKLWQAIESEGPIKDIPARQIYRFNENWFYLEENIESVEQLYLATRPWEKVNLPHTWNVFDAVDNVPGYRRDISWYEKSLYVPALKEDLRILLQFEGVNISSSVYVNGKYAGGHIGGYLGFKVDITDYLEQGAANTIHVRVDNAINAGIIPSQKADFFIYGGITRDVWLAAVPAVHIDRLSVVTPQVTRDEAQVEIGITLNNHTRKRVKYTVEAVVLDREKQPVLRESAAYTTPVGSSTLELRMPRLGRPSLWSPDSPYLYTVVVSLVKSGQQRDAVSENFGFRWFEFKEHGPFYLNGERLLLRGTHRHEDYAGLGNAIPDSLHRKDMQMIKAMGANFVRLAHYPQDPEVYRACDELGLLVWDELPWCRGGKGGKTWEQNTVRMLREMIHQNMNHPSIIIWSLGNEIYWLPDFTGGDEIKDLREFLSQLNDVAHEIDPHRVTAVRKFYEGADIVDVFSPSIWAGWYSGVYVNYERAITQARDEYTRFFHAEYGGASHVGRHVENPISGEGVIDPEGWEEAESQVQVRNIARYGDWSENYIVDLFDWHLHISELAEWLTGNAQWAFKDFGTPLRPENPIPYINQKGLVDRGGKPKDAYYVFKSYWTDAPQFCYIESHTWTDREGPEGKAREISVYSNCEEVELLLNGQGLGKRKRDRNNFPAMGLRWEVDFTEGRNELYAIGYSKGRRAAADSMQVRYRFARAAKPDHILLSGRELDNGNILIEALMVDQSGRRCLDYDDRVYFSHSGDGCLISGYGTPTRSDIIAMANGRAAIEFRPLPDGKAVIEARNQEFKGAYLIIGE
ncbi:MAG: glycoside hydrolase family 88 protein [Fidelibacterota bacterium]|nr:MAG: glycoside hydrolase family 88 protein [Candidatus Neomarinimicrobiota bacterium]